MSRIALQHGSYRNPELRVVVGNGRSIYTSSPRPVSGWMVVKHRNLVIAAPWLPKQKEVRDVTWLPKRSSHHHPFEQKQERKVVTSDETKASKGPIVIS